MRRLFFLFILIVSIYFLPIQSLHASSEQAYADYIYQYNTYRTAYNEFKVAKNEYDKFHTLTSQATVLEKTKAMLTWRDNLLRSYLLFLGEKLKENPGVEESDRSLYQTLIDNENAFLVGHSSLISSIGSIKDATEVSRKLESHYMVLQISIRQIILGLSAGSLNYHYLQYVELVRLVSEVLESSRIFIPVGKQSVADRWLVSIRNSQNLYEQKIDQIHTSIATLNAHDLAALEQKTTVIQKDLGEAKTYLQQGSSYMKELLDSLRYIN